MLRQIKGWLREQLALEPWMVLMTAGLLTHVALNLLLRKSPFSAWGLLAPLVLGVALEGYEIWDHYRGALLAPGSDPLLQILLRHLLDVARMLAAPLLLVLAGLVLTRS